MMMQYHGRYLLPAHRMQRQLALIAKVTVGGESNLDDFILKYRPPAPAGESEAFTAASWLSGITGGKVKVLGARRRAREALH